MDAIPAQVNVRARTLDARADGSPIIAGTVNYYVIALTGANAGKWFRDSDDSWQVAEAICGAMAHKADGHWTVSVAAACWIDGVEYMEYAREDGDLHVPVSNMFRSRPLSATPGAEMDLVDAPNATALEAITDDVIDEVLDGSHNVANSLGRRIRQLEDVFILHDGTAAGVGGGNNTIELDGAASAVMDFYLEDWIILVGGLGAGQLRHVDSYDGGTKIATMGSDWIINPDNTTKFIIKGRTKVHVHDIDAVGLASIQAAADAALVANHLDHLLKTTYDPASKPGAADALLNELVESDGGVSRFTENALEQAPDTTTGLTLHGDYDAAKSAAAPGAVMKVDTGSGANQLDVTSGVIKANFVQILGTALTEAVGGYLAAAFKKLFNVASPVLVASDVMVGTDGANTTTPPTAAAIRTEIESGDLSGVKSKTDGLNFTGNDVNATLDGEETTTDAASRLASKADVSGLSTHDAAAVKTAVEAGGSHLTLIKAATDGLNFTGTDVKVTLDGEEVVTDAASRTASKAIVAGLSTHDAAAVKTALEVGGSKLDILYGLTEDVGGRRFTEKALEEGAAGSGLNAQQTRDSMKLAPTAGAPAVGSVDEHLDDTLAIADKLDSAMEADGGVHRFTTNGLEMAPGGAGAGAVTISEATLDLDDTEALGKVETDMGVPIAGAIVNVYADADTDLATVLYMGMTDGDGGFSIQVAPGAIYRTKAVSSGYAFDTERVST